LAGWFGVCDALTPIQAALAGKPASFAIVPPSRGKGWGLPADVALARMPTPATAAASQAGCALLLMV